MKQNPFPLSPSEEEITRTKQKLKQLADYEERCRGMRERIAALRSRAEGFGRAPDGLPHVPSGEKRPMESCVVAMVDLEARLQQEEAALFLAGQCLYAAIDRLSVPARRRVLLLRYAEGLEWPELEQRMRRNVKTCMGYHRDALVELTLLLRAEAETDPGASDP